MKGATSWRPKVGELCLFIFKFIHFGRFFDIYSVTQFLKATYYARNNYDFFSNFFIIQRGITLKKKNTKGLEKIIVNKVTKFFEAKEYSVEQNVQFDMHGSDGLVVNHILGVDLLVTTTNKTQIGIECKKSTAYTNLGSITTDL
ncbi:MAG: hypothetical protein DRP87_09620 [Spirochaetes bacterium]|nr:MAG: hypothetical protein DRP87_09620 [Spirochaetota bacterium]